MPQNDSFDWGPIPDISTNTPAHSRAKPDEAEDRQSPQQPMPRASRSESKRVKPRDHIVPAAVYLNYRAKKAPKEETPG